MNLKKELVSGLVEAIAAEPKDLEHKPDVLWFVTSFRVDVFRMLYNLNLNRPGLHYQPENVDRQLIADLLCDYADIVASFPSEVKYNDSSVEHPRVNAVTRTFEVVEGLTSDDDTWASAQELSRLIATNADSEHQKLDYAVLMGIALRILELVNFDITPICEECIQNINKTEA